MERLLALAGIESVSSILVQCLQVTEAEFKYLRSRFFPDLELNTRSYRQPPPPPPPPPAPTNSKTKNENLQKTH